MKRQKFILAVLLGIFALALLYAFWATPRQRSVAEVEGTPVSRPSPPPAEMLQENAPEEETLRVRLELLQREPEGFSGARRDIFQFPRPKRPPPVAAPSPPKAPPAPSPPEPAVLGPAEVKKELARFRFLGFLLKGTTKTVFLQSEEDIFVVKEGDRFGEEKEFLVTDLNPEAITIRQRGDERPILVPLVEQEPLVPRGDTWERFPAARPRQEPRMEREPDYPPELEMAPDNGSPPGDGLPINGGAPVNGMPPVNGESPENESPQQPETEGDDGTSFGPRRAPSNAGGGR